MSRSGYSDDNDDQWATIRWRGAVNAAIKGKRGQQFLRELAAAMDAMPEKRLVANELQADGAFCALGVVGAARGIDMSRVDPDDRECVAKMFGVAEAMAAEIMWENDEAIDQWVWQEVEVYGPIQPWERRERTVRVLRPNAEERRWRYMRDWVAGHIAKASGSPAC